MGHLTAHDVLRKTGRFRQVMGRIARALLFVLPMLILLAGQIAAMAATGDWKPARLFDLFSAYLFGAYALVMWKASERVHGPRVEISGMVCCPGCGWSQAAQDPAVAAALAKYHIEFDCPEVAKGHRDGL